jgi:Polyketide cyclase / dehydrase and lipid transport
MPRNPEASVEIDAPLALVWDVMLDTASYGAWNPFVVRADCPSPPKPGDPIVLHVRWASGKGARSPERIAIVDGPATDATGTTSATLAYDYVGWPSKVGLIRGRRYQRLSQQVDGPTLYDTVEEFSGPLVKLAGPGRVAEGFRRHAGALKERAEGLVAGR